MTVTDNPAAHLASDDIPYVDTEDGNRVKLLQVNRNEGLWVTEVIFSKSYSTPKHRHTGPVWGYTFSGSWRYLEYNYVNRAGSFLYEPAGSEHTLEIMEDETHAIFHTWGSNLNLSEDGAVASVLDAERALDRYLSFAEAQGYGRPPIILG